MPDIRDGASNMIFGMVANATGNDRRRMSRFKPSMFNADMSANLTPACRCGVAHSIREGYIR